MIPSPSDLRVQKLIRDLMREHDKAVREAVLRERLSWVAFLTGFGLAALAWWLS